jgi:dynactin complex subunit
MDRMDSDYKSLLKRDSAYRQFYDVLGEEEKIVQKISKLNEELQQMRSRPERKNINKKMEKLKDLEFEILIEGTSNNMTVKFPIKTCDGDIGVKFDLKAGGIEQALCSHLKGTIVKGSKSEEGSVYLRRDGKYAKLVLEGNYLGHIDEIANSLMDIPQTLKGIKLKPKVSVSLTYEGASQEDMEADEEKTLKKPTIREAIRKYYSEHPQFSYRELVKYSQDNDYNFVKSSIRTALLTMKTKGELKHIDKGKGVYKVAREKTKARPVSHPRNPVGFLSKTVFSVLADQPEYKVDEMKNRLKELGLTAREIKSTLSNMMDRNYIERPEDAHDSYRITYFGIETMRDKYTFEPKYPLPSQKPHPLATGPDSSGI